LNNSPQQIQQPPLLLLQPSVLAIQAAVAALLLVAVVVHGVVLVACMCWMYGLAHLMTFNIISHHTRFQTIK
jgi:hypothetical protein